jgi:hypothetical protein
MTVAAMIDPCVLEHAVEILSSFSCSSSFATTTAVHHEIGLLAVLLSITSSEDLRAFD